MHFRSGNSTRNMAGVYLPRLRYEQPVSIMQLPQNRFAYQDALINQSMMSQERNSALLRSDAAAESTIVSRYGLMLKNYLDLITGTSEYLR